MGQPVWKEIFTDSSFNTAVAASGSEQIRSTNPRIWEYNSLIVTNRDITDIEIRLNGESGGGRSFQLQAGDTLQIQPHENIWFSWLLAVNLDAANAQTANKILYRWAHAKRLE